MYIWSLVLTMLTNNVALQQLPSVEGTVCIQVPVMEQQKGTVQCTIYDEQQVPVRMIPLEGGHKLGVYTLQLRTLAAGNYVVSVQDLRLSVKLK
ncbi:hypothetical protein GFS24_05025 [Chitinophaga sp. SYP-B3965]|uniref:hypothetical protein n=1 Tax=Chitinophaga sp. SYP-B3965 TaxID=2663120 RepID=UPI001299D350|nr:hypothetical protein [Chitinophaga sp. SYP-B3965]MRG44462.1 hypothetical protein [Chitinophaga sp. SYP-B3965]